MSFPWSCQGLQARGTQERTFLTPRAQEPLQGVAVTAGDSCPLGDTHPYTGYVTCKSWPPSGQCVQIPPGQAGERKRGLGDPHTFSPRNQSTYEALGKGVTNFHKCSG